MLMLQRLNLFRLAGIIAPVLLRWKWIGMFLRKNLFLWTLGCFSPVNWIGAVTWFLWLKLPPPKLNFWFVLYFFSSDVAMYLYISTIWPWMECCCHEWDGAPSCCLEMLDKFRKSICMPVGLYFDVSLEPCLDVEMLPA